MRTLGVFCSLLLMSLPVTAQAESRKQGDFFPKDYVTDQHARTADESDSDERDDAEAPADEDSFAVAPHEQGSAVAGAEAARSYYSQGRAEAAAERERLNRPKQPNYLEGSNSRRSRDGLGTTYSDGQVSRDENGDILIKVPCHDPFERHCRP